MLKKDIRKLLSVVIAVSFIAVLFVVEVSAGDVSFEYYKTGDDGFGYYYVKGQTFTAGPVSHAVTAVRVKVGRGGYPNTVYAYIYATDANGLPTGPILTSGSTNGNNFSPSADGAWVFINVTAYTLSANTKYALIIYNPSGGYVYWRADITSPTYSGGNCLQNYGSWENWPLWDYMFEIWDTPTGPSYHQGHYTVIQTVPAALRKQWYYWDIGSTKAAIVLYGGTFDGVSGVNVTNLDHLGNDGYYQGDFPERIALIDALNANGYDVFTPKDEEGGTDNDIRYWNSDPYSAWISDAANWLRTYEGHTAVYLFGWSAGATVVAYEIQKPGAENLYNAAVIAEAPVNLINSPNYSPYTTNPMFISAQTAQNTKVPLSFIVHPEDFCQYAYGNQQNYYPMMELYKNNMPANIDKEWHTWGDQTYPNRPASKHDPFPDKCTDHGETLTQVVTNWFASHAP